MKIAFRMKLKPGTKHDYMMRHSPIWEELQQVLKHKGVHSYSIFHDAEYDHLFGYAEIEDLASWHSIAQEAICRQWWEYMAPLMEVNEDKSPKSVELEKVFDLDEQ